LADDILCWLLPKGKRVAWIAENSGSVENLQIDKLPKILHTINWLVLSTPLKNISQLELLFPIYGKNVPNHQPVKVWIFQLYSETKNAPTMDTLDDITSPVHIQQPSHHGGGLGWHTCLEP
jgi:hypothetical protein